MWNVNQLLLCDRSGREKTEATHSLHFNEDINFRNAQLETHVDQDNSKLQFHDNE